MKVLVTGSAGFIASTLIPKLKNKGHTVTGIDSLVSGSKNHLSTTLSCDHLFFDINDTDRLARALEGVDIVYHLAAKGNVVESIEKPIENFHSNVTSTLSLLEAMRSVDCRRIVFASTGGALMGDSPPPVDETTLPKPISPYGASKLACEGYLSAYSKSYGFSSIILRFGNVYGPYSSHKVGVVNRWIRLAIEKKPILIYGDGNSSRDYIHVDDLTDGLDMVLSRFSSQISNVFETYHLANHREITLHELKCILVQCLDGQDLTVNYQPARLGEVSRNFANIDLANSTLGFNPKVDFVDGVHALYKWIKSHEYSSC